MAARMVYSKPYVSYKNGERVRVISASCDRCGMISGVYAIPLGQRLPDLESAVYCEVCVPPVTAETGV